MQQATDKQESPPAHIHVSNIPKYGEVFLCDEHINGVESIHGFKGKKILNISCSARKIFIFEDSTEEENIVSALHDPEHDSCEFNGRRTAAVEDLIAEFDAGEKIVEIGNGRSHSIILTQNGRLFSFGMGEFGTLGHGGSIFEEKPRLIKKLETRTIVSVACGLFHTLALSDIGDVYAWGRGFEGQLGILSALQTSSSPLLIPNYFRKDGDGLKKVEKSRIKSIACGAYHSMAINSNDQLFCWGQARYGQTGHGKTIKEVLPTLVEVKHAGHPQKIKMVSGGFGHTLALTTENEIFSWGLNVKGQLGLGEYLRKLGSHKGTIYEPTKVEWDASGTVLPKFKFISCGHHRSFAIDENGFAWSWGQGSIGFKDSRLEHSPRKIVQGTEERKFDYIVANEDAVVMFAPVRTTSFRPNMTPSKGNTEITLFGTGFIHTEQQTVKFRLGSSEIVLPVQYDGESSTFFFRTPNFEKYTSNFPIECFMEVSLDGHSYVPFQEKLFVYRTFGCYAASDLATHSIVPKCGSVEGGANIQLGIEIHPTILKALSHITVGFKEINTEEKKPKEGAPTEQEEVEEALRLKSWVCVEGTYANGEVSCKAPKLPAYKAENPFYHVDISLNGQQFTGMPSTFRFYELKNITVAPSEGLPDGGYELTLVADGLFGSNALKLYLKAQVKHLEEEFELGRIIESFDYDKASKKLTFKMPPLTWLLGDRTATAELLTSVKQVPLRIMLTLSGQQWLQAGTFRFVDPPPPPPEPQEDKKDSKKDTKKAGKK